MEPSNKRVSLLVPSMAIKHQEFRGLILLMTDTLTFLLCFNYSFTKPILRAILDQLPVLTDLIFDLINFINFIEINYSLFAKAPLSPIYNCMHS